MNLVVIRFMIILPMTFAQRRLGGDPSRPPGLAALLVHARLLANLPRYPALSAASGLAAIGPTSHTRRGRSAGPIAAPSVSARCSLMSLARVDPSPEAAGR